MLQYSLTNDSISLVVEGRMHTIRRGAPNFLPLRAALLEERWDDARRHLTVRSSLEAWARGRFSLQSDTVLFDGQPIPEELNRRMLEMATQGESPESLFLFWEKLSRNPSWRSIQQLWKFLEHNHIPLTPDGDLLTYKGVRQDFRDKHSGTFDNRPGTTHAMPRNQISDDPNEACHFGFHVGSLGYARNFKGEDGKLVICKVNPADVVSVPYDHDHQKVRVCKYTVVGLHGADLPDTVFNDDLPDAPDEVRTEERTMDENRTATSTIPVDPPAPHGHPFDLLKTKDLLEKGITELRQYATHHLKVVGASKIPGGKTALVRKIEEARSTSAAA